MRYIEQKTECGTVHCLGEWASQDRWFQAQGLSALADFGHWRYFFALSPYDASRLFAAGIFNAWAPRSAVIANIDRLLRGESAVAYA